MSVITPHAVNHTLRLRGLPYLLESYYVYLWYAL